MQTIPTLGKAWKVSFDLTLFGEIKDWSNIIHLSIGGNMGKYGDRTPTVQTVPGTTKLHFGSSVNGKKNYNFNSEDMPVNKKIRVVIEQKFLNNKKYQYSVYIDGKQIHTVENKKAEEFKNVKVYVSDPWYEPANAQIENIVIENNGKHFSFKSTGFFNILFIVRA